MGKQCVCSLLCILGTNQTTLVSAWYLVVSRYVFWIIYWKVFMKELDASSFNKPSVNPMVMKPIKGLTPSQLNYTLARQLGYNVRIGPTESDGELDIFIEDLNGDNGLSCFNLESTSYANSSRVLNLVKQYRLAVFPTQGSKWACETLDTLNNRLIALVYPTYEQTVLNVLVDYLARGDKNVWIPKVLIKD